MGGAGSSISAHGRISFYEPRGSTDFLVDIAMPQGLGELSLELERLRKELERLEGSMSRRSEAREAIVHRRIAELVGDEDELDF